MPDRSPTLPSRNPDCHPPPGRRKTTARPRLLNPDIPRDLETISLKCLEKDPSKRYPTAQSLADDLQRYLNNEPISARPIGPTGKLLRWSQRNPALATAYSLLILLLLVILISSPLAIYRINRARLEAEKSRGETDRARSQVERNLYATEMQLASESLRHGALGQVEELLKHYYPRKNNSDLRGFEWRYLAKTVQNQKGLVTHRFQGLKAQKAGETPGLVIAGDTLYDTPDTSGKFEVDPRPILAWDLKTWAPISLALPLESNSDLWWYPHSEAALAVNAKDHTATVYHLPHLEKGPVISLPGQAIQAAVSKNFHTLAVAFRDGDLRHVLVWDLVANIQRSIFGEFRGWLSRMDFSPDSSVLMVEWDNREISLWSVADNKALPSPPIDLVPDWEPEPSPFFAPHSTRLFRNRVNSKDLQIVGLAYRPALHRFKRPP